MSLKDDMMKHRIFVQRLQNTQKDVITSQLDQLRLAAHREAVIGLQASSQATLRDVIAPLKDLGITSLVDIAEYESQFASKVYSKYLEETIAPIDRDILEKVFLTQNMAINTVKKVDGEYVVNEEATKRSISAAYEQFGRRKADELVQIIKDGEVNNLTASEIINNINERVAGLQSTQAGSLALTSVNYSTNVAKTETISQSDVIQYVQWDADAELNHCDYCEEQNGQIWPIDEAPDTQVHYGCNCELIPIENYEQV